MKKTVRLLVKSGLLCLSLVVGLALAELSLRIIDSFQTHDFAIWRPGQALRVNAAGWKLRGVGPVDEIKVSSEGFLGPERPLQPSYEIVALGGSTTECYFLGAEKAWPCLAQDQLKRRTGQCLWIGNGGKSGLTTRDHVVQLKHLLPEFPSVDAVILLVGANDLLLRLEQDQRYDPLLAETNNGQANLMARAFGRYPDRYRPFPENLKIYQLVEDLRLDFWLARHRAEQKDHPYDRYRRMRARARLLGELPDMEQGLAEYRRNLKTIINQVRAAGRRPIFMTQPVMWRADLGEQEDGMLWLGYRGGRGSPEYYSAAALQKGMDMYNQCLRGICRAEDVECIDLAKALPKSPQVFYDDCHFNDVGSAMVARIVADYLAQHPPFAGKEPGRAASPSQPRPEAQ